MPAPKLVLASSSPRRRQILDTLGIAFEVRARDVPETRAPGESAKDMVVRLARDKAEAARRDAGEIVLAADTAVVLGDTVFGKPADESDALGMLSLLSGQRHAVVTGVAVFDGDKMATALSNSEVTFRAIAPEEARRYWQSGEPRDKAGAYAIQGVGGMFVTRIRGSYSGIVGLPVFETVALLGQAGIQVLPE